MDTSVIQNSRVAERAPAASRTLRLGKIAPRTARVALLFNPATSPQLQFYMPSIKATASSVAVEVSDAPVHAKEEIEGVIAAQARSPRAGGQARPKMSFDICERHEERMIWQTCRSGSHTPEPPPFSKNDLSGITT